MLLAHSPTHQRSLARQQPGVTVNLHGFSLGEGGFSTPKPQGGPCDKRGWDLQLASHGHNGPLKPWPVDADDLVMMTAVESMRYWHCGCGYSNLEIGRAACRE